jgi:hypothetical protein
LRRPKRNSLGEETKPIFSLAIHFDLSILHPSVKQQHQIRNNMSIIKIALAALLGCIGFLITAVIFALLLAIPVWLLWNWVGVEVLALKHITLLQALGLAWLSALLFKSNK